jgi:hypothetical protein
LTEHFAHKLAVLVDLEVSEFRCTVADAFTKSDQEASSVGGSERTPVTNLERAAGTPDRGVDILF